MDMKIAGSGSIGTGEYDNIKISGSGKLQGPIRCKSMHCSGSAHCFGSLEASENAIISGSAHIESDLKAQKICISGSAKIGGNCTASEDIKIAGGFHCEGDIKSNKLYLAGGSYSESIEAEEVNIDGKIVCPGLVNAEKIEIKIQGTGSEIGSIGGSVIEIKRKNHIIGTKLLLFKNKAGARGNLRVKDSIEADEITIDHVEADTVIGRIVKIGAGCNIKQVHYSESIEISPDAEIGEQIKL